MARVGNNSSNLIGRDRYDLLIFKFTEGYPVGNIKLAFGETPKRISGVQKVAQIFTKVLMSRRSSDVLHNTSGTDFSEFSAFSNVSDSDGYRVRSEIEASISRAESQAKSILNFNGASFESQLDSVEVLGVSANGDNVSVQVKILTKAGEEAPIALPFTSLGIKVNE